MQEKYIGYFLTIYTFILFYENEKDRGNILQLRNILELIYL